MCFESARGRPGARRVGPLSPRHCVGRLLVGTGTDTLRLLKGIRADTINGHLRRTGLKANERTSDVMSHRRDSKFAVIQTDSCLFFSFASGSPTGTHPAPHRTSTPQTSPAVDPCSYTFRGLVPLTVNAKPVHVHTPATSGVRQGEKSRMRVGQARAGTRTSAEPVQLGDGLQPAHRRLDRQPRQSW